MAITREVNIEMLEKLADGNFKIKYPKTTGAQVKMANGETAEQAISSAGKVKSVNTKTGDVVLVMADMLNETAFNSKVLEGTSIRLGPGASFMAGVGAIAIGNLARAIDYYAVAIGEKANADGSSSTAIGYNSKAMYDGTTAIGANAQATQVYTVALGVEAVSNNQYEGILGNTTRVKTWKVPGSFAVNGTKNFEIPHPKPSKKATHVIRHGAVESPSAGDTLYRYKVNSTKENDIRIIELPDYFIHLNKDVQVFVTPQGHFGNGYGALNRETEQLEIHCQYEGEYNVLVIGTRNDDHRSVQDWDIKGVEREIGESWTGETYIFEVDEITEIEEIKEVV